MGCVVLRGLKQELKGLKQPLRDSLKTSHMPLKAAICLKDLEKILRGFILNFFLIQQDCCSLQTNHNKMNQPSIKPTSTNEKITAGQGYRLSKEITL